MASQGVAQQRPGHPEMAKRRLDEDHIERGLAVVDAEVEHGYLLAVDGG
nr:hypothetical protein [Janthinobacterium sp. FT58W]